MQAFNEKLFALPMQQPGDYLGAGAPISTEGQISPKSWNRSEPQPPDHIPHKSTPSSVSAQAQPTGDVPKKVDSLKLLQKTNTCIYQFAKMMEPFVTMKSDNLASSTKSYTLHQPRDEVILNQPRGTLTFRKPMRCSTIIAVQTCLLGTPPGMVELSQAGGGGRENLAEYCTCGKQH